MASSPEAAVSSRLFFALWPPPEVVRGLRRLQERELAQVPGRRITPERLHLTLRFVGAVSEPVAECLRRAAAAVRIPPFTLRIDRLGAFPRAKVVWAGIASPPPALLALAAALEQACQGCGLPAETREFAPHLTLLRKAHRHLPRRDTSIEPLVWPVSEFVLAASQTRPEGAVYRVLARWPLRAGEGRPMGG